MRNSGLLNTSLPSYIVASIAVMLSPGAAAQDNPHVPEYGNRATAALSLKEEESLAQLLLAELQREPLSIQDPIADEWLYDLIGRLRQGQLAAAGRQFHSVILLDPRLNAFAVPGGVFGFNYGLFRLADEEAQFAAVAAHEIAHVTEQHFARSNLSKKDSARGSALSVFAAILGGISFGPAVGFAGLFSSLAKQQQDALSFSRLAESEADVRGFRMMEAANYDLDGPADMFATMLRNIGDERYRLPGYLSSHPLTSDRVNKMRTLATSAQERGLKGRKDSERYQLVRRRLDSVVSPLDLLQSSLSDLEKADTNHDRRIATYGLAMAHWRLGRYQSAIDLLAALMEDDQINLLFPASMVEIMRDAGQPGDAVSAGLDALELAPGNYPLALATASASREIGRTSEALVLLKSIHPHWQSQPAVLLEYTRVHEASGNLFAFKRSQADYLASLGHYDQAIRELIRLLPLANNYPEVYVAVEGTISELAELQKQQRALLGPPRNGATGALSRTPASAQADAPPGR